MPSFTQACALLAVLAALLAGCAAPTRPSMSIDEGRARVAGKLPPALAERASWAADIHAAMESLKIELSDANICAIVAVTEQESGFKVDPLVPNLATAVWKEIDTQRERAGIPKLVLQAALALPSTTGRSYRERLDAAKTERELSDIFEDFIGRVPLGKAFLEDRNPVRTGGPMQVSVAYAKSHAATRRYPYPVSGSLREEVFTRRGGMYFGIAHLLDYPAGYDRYVYRFADFNAGHYASRNAAFQKALAEVSGTSLALDGDLLRYGPPGSGTWGEKPVPTAAPSDTETAARAIARRLELAPEQIRHDLELGRAHEFEGTRLYKRVFALADAGSKRAARAVVPQIALASAKFTRKLTTEWFATRVVERHRGCMARGAKSPSAMLSFDFIGGVP